MAERDALRALEAYGFASRELRQRIIAQASSMWTDLGSWHGADVDRFAVAVAPLVIAGRRHMATITDAYLAASARARLGSGRPHGVSDAVLASIRNGAPVEAVYRRPGVTVWSAVSKGTEWPTAVQFGLSRLQSMLATDLQLARTFATREVLSNDRRVIGYLRVPSGASCELCEVASDNAYHSADLMPIHNNCNCDVEPLYADHDTERLSERQTSWVNRDQGDKPAVHEHGELGPVLAVAGQNFTGPDDLAA